jgi:hypothetical protein
LTRFTKTAVFNVLKVLFLADYLEQRAFFAEFLAEASARWPANVYKFRYAFMLYRCE